MAATTKRGRRALRQGVIPTLEPQAILRRIDPDVVLDVGANRGQFTLDVRTAVPNATVVAFEPLASEAAIYRRIHGGDAAVHLVPVALSDVTGRSEFHVNREADSSSLHAPTELQTTVFPGTDEESVIQVDTVRFDELELPVKLGESTLLKIDVQGHEQEVLAGARKRLHEVRWVLVEVSFVELYEGQALAGPVVGDLHEAGFALVDMLDPVRRGARAVQVDLLFERTKKRPAGGRSATQDASERPNM